MSKVLVYCDTCGTELRKYLSLVKTHNFCNDTCYRTWRKTLTGELNKHWKGGPVTLICPQCGAAFQDVPSAVSRRTFCSVKCKADYQAIELQEHPEQNPRWKHGRHRNAYSRGWKAVKLLVSERDGRVCRICGCSKEIEHHHIDLTTTNHTPDNVVLLCNSCHQRIHKGTLVLG